MQMGATQVCGILDMVCDQPSFHLVPEVAVVQDGPDFTIIRLIIRWW
jgi:hypothetical protein